MITTDYIRNRIEKHGFLFTGKFGIGRPPTRRFEGPSVNRYLGRVFASTERGSLYIRDNYLSATGQYTYLQELVPPVSHDAFSAKAPEWKGKALMDLLDKLDELFTNPKSENEIT